MSAAVADEAKLEQGAGDLPGGCPSWPEAPVDPGVARALRRPRLSHLRRAGDGAGGWDDRDASLARLPEELARILLLEARAHESSSRGSSRRLGPVHAKGVEDTAFDR